MLSSIMTIYATLQLNSYNDQFVSQHSRYDEGYLFTSTGIYLTTKKLLLTYQQIHYNQP